jgi:acyl-CoA synthetase (AMP-forming)/AMP-acid ligase II
MVLVDHAVTTGTRSPCSPETGSSQREITERILELSQASGHKAALIDAPQGTVTAWPRFGRMVRAAADGLRHRGLADGDSAAVFVQDAASFALAVNAIRAAGAIPCAIAPGATMAQVADRLNASGARVLITASPLAELAAEAADRSRVRQLFSFGDAPGTTPFRSLLGVAKHGRAPDGPALDKHGGAPDGDARREDSHRGDAERGPRTPDAADGRGVAWTGWPTDFPRPGFALSHRDVVVTCPPCGDGQAYTSMIDLTLLTGATIVAAPVPLITAAMRAYNGTAAIVPQDTDVPGLPPDRVFGVA